jgi:DNA repair photolyase
MIIYKEVKSVLNRHKKRDNWFHDDYSVNPYEGCGFNCIYCYIRGSRYGENLAEKIAVKKNATTILDRQLANRAKKGEYGFIAVGSATDAYMQVEEELQQTRKLLEVILKHRFPVFISTKSMLIKRDIDLLKEIDRAAITPQGFPPSFKKGVILGFSVSTLDEKTARLLEPGAPSPAQRLETLQTCKASGLMAGVNAIPLLPFISDTDEELKKMVKAAKAHSADFFLAGGITLSGNGPADSKSLYYRFLQRHYPEFLDRYKAMFGDNYYQPWPYHNELRSRVSQLCKQYELQDSILAS